MLSLFYRIIIVDLELFKANKRFLQKPMVNKGYFICNSMSNFQYVIFNIEYCNQFHLANLGQCWVTWDNSTAQKMKFPIKDFFSEFDPKFVQCSWVISKHGVKSRLRMTQYQCLQISYLLCLKQYVRKGTSVLNGLKQWHVKKILIVENYSKAKIYVRNYALTLKNPKNKY